MTHLFKLNAAQQQVDWRRAPHVGLGQRLVANHRHANRVRLGWGVAFTFNVTRRDRAFLDLRHRLAGFAVKHEDHALLAGLHQQRRGAALAVRQVVQQRLGRQVEVPQVMVGGLEMPADLAGGRVDGDDGGTVLIVQRGTLARPEVWRGVAGWQVDQVQFGVVRHRRPDVRRAAGVGLAFRRQAGQVRITRIPRPGQLTGVNVVGADHARRLAGRVVIRDATADDNDVPGHQRCRGLLIISWLDLTHTDAQIHGAVVAKVVADLAVIRVNGNQTGVGGGQKQAARACRWRCSGL